MEINWIGLWTVVVRESKRFIRVSVQTLVSPWISAVLFIFVFGSVVGSRISSIGGVSYIHFVLPGILMMNIISSAFGQSSTSLYFHRWTRNIEEMLVAPLSHLEMLVGYIFGAIVRGVVVGLGILVVGLFFGATQIDHFWLFLFYVAGVSAVFGLVGILIGLWANSFEQLNILNTFFIMPLSFLGGVFNTITMLPPSLQHVAYFNPFFYFMDGIRYSMIGFTETGPWFSAAFVLGLILVLGAITVFLFHRGWRLRL